jgi:adenylate cyclase
MGADESGTLERLNALRRELVESCIKARSGRIVKLMGDGLLAEFRSVVEAVRCAANIQEGMVGRELDLPETERISLRIGVNLGDILVEGADIYGDGVNVASRLEALATPGGICLSGAAYDAVEGKLDLPFEAIGPQKVKNIDKPVRVYRLDLAAVRSGSVADLSESPQLPNKPSIAVLPFTNMSNDKTQDHLADGIAEDIITALSKVSNLFVVARNSTFTYKGQPIDIKQVGREQGVRYVLEGSVQRSGQRLRTTAQLIDATSGHHIWAQRYDRVIDDVFDIQDEITREVTSALQVHLTEGEQARLWASGTKNLEAWEAAIQCPALLHSHRRVDVLPARRLAERALQLDENYASAWAMLGWAHWTEVFNGWADDPDTKLSLALDALKRALAIDDSNPDTLALLAFLHLSLRKYGEARQFIEKAMTLGPNNSFAFGVAANVELYSNRPEAMVPLLKRAIRLSPIYPAWYLGDLSYAYVLMGRLEEAIVTANESIKIDPDYIYNYHTLAIAHVELGQIKAARADIENILRIEPKMSVRTYRDSQPYQDETQLNRIVTAFREAGLPE